MRTITMEEVEETIARFVLSFEVREAILNPEEFAVLTHNIPPANVDAESKTASIGHRQVGLITCHTFGAMPQPPTCPA